MCIVIHCEKFSLNLAFTLLSNCSKLWIICLFFSILSPTPFIECNLATSARMHSTVQDKKASAGKCIKLTISINCIEITWNTWVVLNRTGN